MRGEGCGGDPDMTPDQGERRGQEKSEFDVSKNREKGLVKKRGKGLRI